MANKKRLIDVNAFPKSWMLAQFTEYNGRTRLIRTKRLQDVPTVDAVPVVHGRWEDVWGGKYANKKYRCSVCRGKALYDTKRDSLGSWSAEQELTPICPHCGAKMDGGNEDG